MSAGKIVTADGQVIPITEWRLDLPADEPIVGKVSLDLVVEGELDEVTVDRPRLARFAIKEIESWLREFPDSPNVPMWRRGLDNWRAYLAELQGAATR